MERGRCMGGIENYVSASAQKISFASYQHAQSPYYDDTIMPAQAGIQLY